MGSSNLVSRIGDRLGTAVTEWRGAPDCLYTVASLRVPRLGMMLNVTDNQWVVTLEDGLITNTFPPGIHLVSDPGPGDDHRIVFLSTESFRSGPVHLESRSMEAEARISFHVSDPEALAARIAVEPVTSGISVQAFLRKQFENLPQEQGGSLTSLSTLIQTRLEEFGLVVENMSLNPLFDDGVDDSISESPEVSEDEQTVAALPSRDTGEEAAVSERRDPWGVIDNNAQWPVRAQTGDGAVTLPAHARYYLGTNGNQTGPFTLGEIRQQVDNGRIDSDTPVWRPGLTEWVAAGDIGEFDFIPGMDSVSSVSIDSSISAAH